MRFFSIALLVVALVSLTGCSLFGVRNNPRVAKITREQGDSQEETKLDYDRDGRLTNVDDDFVELELEWDDGILSQVTRKDPDGEADDVETKLEYEKGRLVELDARDVDDNTTIDYDKAGRIEKIERDQGDGLSVTTTNYEYDDAGHVTDIVTKSVFNFDDELERSESHMELEYDDGHIVKVSQEDDTQKLDVDIEYEDGRVASFDLHMERDTGVETIEQDGNMEYEYDDDGLIVGADFEADGEPDGTFEIDYDDGDAVDLDVTPISSLFGVPFFDLRGQAYTGIDVHTQAARLAGVSW